MSVVITPMYDYICDYSKIVRVSYDKVHPIVRKNTAVLVHFEEESIISQTQNGVLMRNI